MSTPLILVAEDERDIRDLIVFTLQLSGFEVVQAPNGEEAFNQATKINPDLILMDVRMPKMTGYEACKALKEQEETKDIPVVFLSAKGQEAEISTGLEMGAVDYFLKPFAPDELAAKVNKILADHGKI
jgi:DNA-binding response OmpR family regulator